METAEEKLAWLGAQSASGLQYERVEPDKRANWINQNENDWDDLIPVADKKTKAAKIAPQERAIFKLFSLGIVTNRDEWVYDFSKPTLAERSSCSRHPSTDDDERGRRRGARSVADFVDVASSGL